MSFHPDTAREQITLMPKHYSLETRAVLWSQSLMAADPRKILARAIIWDDPSSWLALQRTLAHLCWSGRL